MSKALVPLSVALLLLPVSANASDPTTRPLPRLETGMHTALITRIATDARGVWAATVSIDKTARVWEVATRKQVAVLRPPQDVGPEGKLYAVAMSPDAVEVAVAGWTGYDWDGQSAIYVFDRASGRMVRRLPALPNAVNHLAYSPDGRWLAAALGGGNGVRVFDAKTGRQTGSDERYGADSLSAHFSPDSKRLLTSCFDGQLRRYDVEDGRLGVPRRAQLQGAQTLLGARFSPGPGRLIAVGFLDSTNVVVLDAESLQEVARPGTVGMNNISLNSLAWSADGAFLVAAGRSRSAELSSMRRWRVSDWSPLGDVVLSRDTVMDLVPLPSGEVLFASADPTWGVVDSAGGVRRQPSAKGDLRGNDRLALSADGRRVGFNYGSPGWESGGFDLVSRSLGGEPPTALARTSAPGLEVENWRSSTPTVNGQLLKLEAFEESYSLAILPDGQRFALGSAWNVWLFDRNGQVLWKKPAPGAVWAVNVTLDGRFVVAAHDDGTIRWLRVGDGEEVLAFFPHADHQRWIAWTPEGFYATSGADAEELMGYHLNRGRDHEGEYVSASQLREQFYQPGLISRRLDADGDALVAEAAQRVGDVREVLAGTKAQPPVLELLSDAEITTEGEVPVQVRIKDGGGGVGRLIYRIDGTELEGRMVGVVASGTESRSFPLPQGRRVITVTATNARGVESLPVRIVANVVPRSFSQPSLYVLAVGVSMYRDAALQRGVKLAAGDAKAIGQLFQDQGSRLYRAVHLRVLTDEHATGAAIRAAFEELAGLIGPQDVFVLYLAGHGISFERTFHFVPWDAVYTSSDALRKRSLNNDDFRTLLAKIAAAKSVVLLDTCSSGGFGREEGRGVEDKDAIDRLSRLSGRAMIAATADEKMAMEGEGGHGAFTYALLEGLHGRADRNANGTIEIGELGDFVEEEVPRLTKAKWGYEQFPFRQTEGSSFALVSKP